MTDAPELQLICSNRLRSISDSFREHEIAARFYPYIGLTHTIRRRGALWVIRISDHCRQAPRPVLEAIVTLLACKLLRKASPADALEVYEQYRLDPEVERRVNERRLLLGKKQIYDPRGEYHSLSDIYRELNEQYFNNQIEIRKLGWGARRSWKRLGHYDPIHHTITVSPTLDSPQVPKSVVCFLLYHEMLHSLFNHPTARRKMRHHSREFRRAEQAFPHYAEAKRFLSRWRHRS